MTLILLITCIQTPYSIAFEESTSVDIFSNIIDFFFFLDICVIFNTSFYDPEMQIIENRCEIAKHYLKGWFLIDFLAIIPFDIFLNSAQFNHLARFARFGRLYKLVKLTRLLRVLKIIKQKNTLEQCSKKRPINLDR